MQMTDWNPAGSGGSQEPPTHRSHTKLWIGLGGGLALVVVIVIVAAVVLLKGPNVPAGTRTSTSSVRSCPRPRRCRPAGG